VCDHKGAAARREEISAGDASTVAFLTAGVLVAGGAALWWAAPRGTPKPAALRVVPALGPAGASLRLREDW
jgi:hypothetical protein